MNREEILKSAMETFGYRSQCDIMIEEMSKLTKAMCKFFRHENNEIFKLGKDVREEIADVQIMLDQMRLIFGDTADFEQYKLARLEDRIENHRRGNHEANL